MKTQDLNNWPKDIRGFEGLLLFAQIWEEMLFDYTIDSYKPTIFNLPGICLELIQTYRLCEINVLSWYCIIPIREELLCLLSSDEICQSLLKDKADYLRHVISDWKRDAVDKNTILHAANLILESTDKQLLDKLKNALCISVISCRKKDILKFARRLLTELLRQGYSAQYLYRRTMSCFFSDAAVSYTKMINSFLAQFNGEDKRYDVVFKLPRDAVLLGRKASPDFLKIEKKLEPKIAGNVYEAEFLKIDSKQVFLIFPNINAKDQYIARAMADSKLFTAASFVGFFVHKLPIKQDINALIYEDSPPKKCFVIDAPIKPTLKRPDMNEEILDKKLMQLFGPFISRNIEKNTQRRLLGALNMHLAGIRADTPENQFANLWTSLETLIGSDVENSTIGIILKNIVPILCLKYLLRFLVNFHKDLLRSTAKYKELKRDHQGADADLVFLLKILVTEEYKLFRNELYKDCERNPLMRYRIFTFHTTFKSLNEASKWINKHEQRISWHLQRIYRARNRFVHSGEFDIEDVLLIENLHTYLDWVITDIVSKMQTQKYCESIEQIFFNFNIEYQAYKKALSNHVAKNLSPLDQAQLIIFGTGL